MTQQTPFVRRQVRKLLLYICGDKDKYRQLRDLHSLKSHMKVGLPVYSIFFMVKIFLEIILYTNKKNL